MPGISETDTELLSLLSWACATARYEDVRATAGKIAATDGVVFVDLDIIGGPAAGGTRIFLLSGASQGGRLLSRITAAIARKDNRRAVEVRLETFPTNVATQSAQRLVELLSPNGTRVQPEPDELRRLEAYRRFLSAEDRNPGVADWAHQAAIIEATPSVAKILGIDAAATRAAGSDREIAATPVLAEPPVVEPLPSANATTVSAGPLQSASAIYLGQADDGASVSLESRVLTRHMAVLGGSGSGKTTFILSVIEELALLGVPSVLVDRKGDFASYADPASWGATGDAEADDRRNALRAKLEVVVYTPARAAGRPLALRLLPSDIRELSDDDRREATRSAADALSDMIGLKNTSKDGQRREVLAQAIAQAAEETGAALDLSRLVERLHEGAPDLENLLRYLDPKARLRTDLAPRLEQLRLGRGELFELVGRAIGFCGAVGSGGRAHAYVSDFAGFHS